MDIFAGNIADKIFKTKIGADTGSVSLNTSMLNVLGELDGLKKNAVLAETLNMNMMQLRDVLQKLYDIGLIEEAKKPAATVDRELLKRIEAYLDNYAGPDSRIVIKEEVARLNTNFVDPPKLIGKLMNAQYECLLLVHFQDDWGIALMRFREGEIIHFRLLDRGLEPRQFQGDLPSFKQIMKEKGDFLTIHKCHSTTRETAAVSDGPQADLSVVLKTMKGFSNDTETVKIDDDLLESWRSKGAIDGKSPMGTIAVGDKSYTVQLSSQSGIKNMAVVSGKLLSTMGVKDGKKISLHPKRRPK